MSPPKSPQLPPTCLGDAVHEVGVLGGGVLLVAAVDEDGPTLQDVDLGVWGGTQRMEVMNEGGAAPQEPPHTPQSLTWARSPSYLYSQVNAASSKRFSSSPTPRAGWASMGFRGTP